MQKDKHTKVTTVSLRNFENAPKNAYGIHDRFLQHFLKNNAYAYIPDVSTRTLLRHVIKPDCR